jgi:hypothetical protein
MIKTKGLTLESNLTGNDSSYEMRSSILFFRINVPRSLRIAIPRLRSSAAFFVMMLTKLLIWYFSFSSKAGWYAASESRVPRSHYFHILLSQFLLAAAFFLLQKYADNVLGE